MYATSYISGVINIIYKKCNKIEGDVNIEKLDLIKKLNQDMAKRLSFLVSDLVQIW